MSYLTFFGLISRIINLIQRKKLVKFKIRLLLRFKNINQLQKKKKSLLKNRNINALVVNKAKNMKTSNSLKIILLIITAENPQKELLMI